MKEKSIERSIVDAKTKRNRTSEREVGVGAERDFSPVSPVTCGSLVEHIPSVPRPTQNAPYSFIGQDGGEKIRLFARLPHQKVERCVSSPVCLRDIAAKLLSNEDL